MLPERGLMMWDFTLLFDLRVVFNVCSYIISYIRNNAIPSD